MFLRLAALAVLAGFPLAAHAEDGEVLTTAGASQPLPAAAPATAPIAVATTSSPGDERRPREIGAWAQGVLDGRPAEAADAEGAPRSRCPPNDGKPHGEVWGSVGTGGYRSVGGVVTQPIGECGSVTVGVSKSEGGYGRRRR
ncbi:hypothetical protein [Phenylobacterium sp. J367]|uniref:hypothetical protein n=1 Tax=Phenylobacterium sp. J367 TaxID=2898435 RepID=UPI00215168DD|nr:hypothetical protein [Phenylobacterium sp. J367]MCR5877917.1 hypothetical protein [Phenylobacterium sp. J367]